MKDSRQPITFDKYSAKMDEIILKYDNVADALIEMVQFAGSIKIKPGRKPVLVKRGKREK